MNSYTYAANNPLIYVDPTRRLAWFIAIPLITTIAGAITGGVWAALQGQNVLAGIGNGALNGLMAGVAIDLGILAFGGGPAIGTLAGTLGGGLGGSLEGAAMSYKNGRAAGALEEFLFILAHKCRHCCHLGQLSAPPPGHGYRRTNIGAIVWRKKTVTDRCDL